MNFITKAFSINLYIALYIYIATTCFKAVKSKKVKLLSDFIERSGIFSFYCFDPGVSFNKLKKKNKQKRKEYVFFVCFANTLDLPMYHIHMYRERENKEWFCIKLLLQTRIYQTFFYRRRI